MPVGATVAARPAAGERSSPARQRRLVRGCGLARVSSVRLAPSSLDRSRWLTLAALCAHLWLQEHKHSRSRQRLMADHEKRGLACQVRLCHSSSSYLGIRTPRLACNRPVRAATHAESSSSCGSCERELSTCDWPPCGHDEGAEAGLASPTSWSGRPRRPRVAARQQGTCQRSGSHRRRSTYTVELVNYCT
jgi:hypothetical protein